MDVKVRDITPDEQAFYRQHGWVKLPSLIARESLAAVSAFVKANIDEHVVDNPNVKSGTFRFWKRPSELEGPMRELAHSQGMARAARRLIGVDAVRYYFDSCVAKQPAAEGGTETGLHQDWLGQPFDRRGALQFWIPLVQVTPQMGTLHYYSGSKRMGPLGRITSLPEGDTLIDLYPELDEHALETVGHMEVGDVAVHDSLTVHGATPNETDRVRWALTVSYMRADVIYTGMPAQVADGQGLEVDRVFDRPIFKLFTDASDATA
jgi:hypothetical protein